MTFEYELMSSVSIIVDDLPTAVDTLVTKLGIAVPPPQAYNGTGGISAVFCRVHKKYVVAPTFVELVVAMPYEDGDPHVFAVEDLKSRQQGRPVKVHATLLAMPEERLKALQAHLEERGVAYSLLGNPPLERLIVGKPGPTIDWDADAGLFVEGVPSSDLRLGEEGFTGPADIPPDAAPGTMIRVVAREYLVKNLDDTLRMLERNLGWKPRSVQSQPGCRRAVMPFTAPRSAVLELVEPVGPGPVADAFAEVGPGAWTVRIAVFGLDAKAKDLSDRGTPFTFADGVIRPDPKATLHVPFEFVEA